MIKGQRVGERAIAIDVEQGKSYIIGAVVVRALNNRSVMAHTKVLNLIL